MNKQVGFNETQIKQLNEVLDIKFKKELKPIKLKLNKIDKEINFVIGHFDKEVLSLDKRTARVERHLQLQSL